MNAKLRTFKIEDMTGNKFNIICADLDRLIINLEDREIISGQKFSYLENSVIFDYHSICLNNPDFHHLPKRNIYDMTLSYYSVLNIPENHLVHQQQF